MTLSKAKIIPINHRSAEDWLDLLQTGGPEVKTAFMRWLKKSPQCVKEVFIQIAMDDALEDALQKLPPDFLNDLAEISARPRD